MIKIINISGQTLSIQIVKDKIPTSVVLGVTEENRFAFSESYENTHKKLEKMGLIKIREVEEPKPQLKTVKNQIQDESK